MSQIEDLSKEIKASLSEVTVKLQKHADDSAVAIKNAEQLSKDTKADVDKLLIESAQLRTDLKAAELLIVKLDSGEGSTKKSESLGELFVNSEGFTEFAIKASGTNAKMSHTFGVKAAITSFPGSAGALIQPDRTTGLIAPLNQRLFLRDLLSAGRTVSNSIEFIRETGFTNNANVVSEGPANPKPQSNIIFEADSAPIATIAHWIIATKQVLADAPMLQSYINGRLMYGLKLKEEAQLLKGSGVGLNINGLFTQATNYVNPGVTVQNETSIDRLRIAMLQVVLAELDPDGIVLSPIDWTTIELLKNTQDNYLFTQPQGVARPTLWGLPVVATQSMDAGDFLVGSFQQGAQIWDREDANITVSNEDRDNFVKNMVTILAEERVGLTVFRPEAFVKGDLIPAS